jgi:ATP-dependent RNA helicase DOB1
MSEEILQEWGWGVVVNCRSVSGTASSSTGTSSEQVESVLGLAENQKCSHVLDVLLEISSLGEENAVAVVAETSPSVCVGGVIGVRPAAASSSTSPSELVVIQVAIHCIASVSAVRLNLPKDLRKASGRQGTHKALKEVKRRFDAGDSVPLLDPVSDMGIREEAFEEMSDRTTELRKRLASSRFHQLGDDKVDQLESYEKKILLLEESRKYR